MTLYHPQIFDTPDDVAARAIILTPEGESTESRWERETPYLASLVRAHCETKRVLDFGCGIGRMASALLVDPGVTCVAGIDTSADMRRMAEEAVADERFAAFDPGMLAPTQAFDTALMVWVLQHVFDPVLEVARVRAFLKPGGRLFIVNNIRRAVPVTDTTTLHWLDDGFDVRALLKAAFREIEYGTLSSDHMPAVLVENAFWGVYER